MSLKSKPNQLNILLIEDNPGDAFLVEEYLRNSESVIHEIHWAAGWNEAVEILRLQPISVIVLDLNLAGTKGLETFAKFEKIAFELPIVVLSGYQEKDIALETMKRGAQDYLVKGSFNETLLGKAINYAVERHGFIKNLWQKEEEYKYLFENNPNPLLTWDVSTLRFMMANKAAVDFYGWSTKEFIKRKVTDLFDPEELILTFEPLVDRLQTATYINNKKQVKGGNQNCVVDLVLKDAVLNGVQSRIMLVNDITERQLANEKLVQSEQQLRKLAVNYPNGIIAIIDKNMIFHFVDGLELHKRGLAPESLIGTCYTDFLDEANKKRFTENMEVVFNGGQSVFYEERGTESSLISASGLSNSEGEIIRAILVSQNITGNILAKKEIVFQANILNNVNEAIVVKDIHGKVIYWNEGAHRLFGYTFDQVVGKAHDELLNHISADINFNTMVEIIALKGKYRFDFHVERADGISIVVETTQSFMNDEKGKPYFIIGISHDITDRVEAEKILKESEANLKAIFQSTSQSFLLMNTDTRIVAFNENAAKAILAFYHKQVKKGDLFKEFVLPDRHQKFDSHFKEVLNRKIVNFEEKFNFPGKDDVYLEVTYSPVLKDEKVIGIIMCAEDTTQRFLSKETILKSEQKYRELVETSIDMIWTVDKKGTVIFVNNAAIDILGWEPDEIVGRSFIEFVGPDDKERVYQTIMDVMKTTDRYSNYESSILRKNGTVANVITHAVVNHDNITGEAWLTGTSRDITERVYAEKLLNQKNEQLQLLSSYLQTIREEERKHIAREIHDELGQQLTGLKMDLAWMNRKSVEKNSDLSDKLADMLKLVDETIKTIRKISSDLRPGILDDLGLIPAVEWQCHEFEKRTKIKCNFLNRVPDALIDKEASTGVFRILQESLTNIARHSDATEVKVEFDQKLDQFLLLINDNGKGFEQDKILIKQTLGLVGMRERAGMLNGSLTILSTPNKGTQVSLLFPVKTSELEKI